jgi:hypothetical protein
MDTMYKIYNDGGHYIATVPACDKRKGQHSGKSTIFDPLFDYFYLSSIKLGLKDSERFDYIKSGLTDNFGDACDFDNYIAKSIERKVSNLHGRKRRFRRKAFLNDWNYFVTVTYDDRKHTADSFKRKLKKCLANLHTRRGWKYMGVFEVSPNERIHFHAIMYIPDGEMIGIVTETKDYNFKYGNMKSAMQNSFFLNRFGRNDFERLEHFELEYGNTINYLLKYMGKTDERIVYSRAIPTELFKRLDKDDIAAELYDFVCKYILFDDVFDDDDVNEKMLI